MPPHNQKKYQLGVMGRSRKRGGKLRQRNGWQEAGWKTYDSLEEALAVNAEIKEARGRSVDDAGADWKRKAHPLNIPHTSRSSTLKRSGTISSRWDDSSRQVGKQLRGRDGGTGAKEVNGRRFWENINLSAFSVNLTKGL